ARAAHESLKVAKTRPGRSVQGCRTEPREGKHQGVPHASEKGHRVRAAAGATAAGENTRGGKRDWIGFRLRSGEGDHRHQQSTHDRCFQKSSHIGPLFPNLAVRTTVNERLRSGYGTRLRVDVFTPAGKAGVKTLLLSIEIAQAKRILRATSGSSVYGNQRLHRSG